MDESADDALDELLDAESRRKQAQAGAPTIVDAHVPSAARLLAVAFEPAQADAPPPKWQLNEQREDVVVWRMELRRECPLFATEGAAPTAEAGARYHSFPAIGTALETFKGVSFEEQRCSVYLPLHKPADSSAKIDANELAALGERKRAVCGSRLSVVRCIQ